MFRSIQAAGLAIGVGLLFASTACSAKVEQTGGDLTADQMRQIAVDTYIYAYPLVMMELTRRSAIGQGATINEFQHYRSPPDPNFTLVVRPNADTLYSQLWYDVSQEPIVINIPDSAGRYYLLPTLDMWTEVFSSVGSRTTGNGAQTIVIAGNDWQGEVPSDATLIRSPTAMGWIIGRMETSGPADYADASKLQDGLVVTPLSQVGHPYSAPRSVPEHSWDLKTPPSAQIERLAPGQFFGLFGELMKTNPPLANDYPIVHQMARMGIEPGKSFTVDSGPPDVRQAFADAPAQALALIKGAMPRMGVAQNGWRTNLTTMGAYGTAYLQRAVVAYAGLGANLVEDAVYPTAVADSQGQALSSDLQYMIHFAKGGLPPVHAFWSLTMYDGRQLFAANPIHRYAIGDRDKLKFNADGSLDIYIQKTSPGPQKESNWLPTPATGPFSLNLRLYWPKDAVIAGTWMPPPVEPVSVRARVFRR